MRDPRDPTTIRLEPLPRRTREDIFWDLLRKAAPWLLKLLGLFLNWKKWSKRLKLAGIVLALIIILIVGWLVYQRFQPREASIFQRQIQATCVPEDPRLCEIDRFIYKQREIHGVPAEVVTYQSPSLAYCPAFEDIPVGTIVSTHNLLRGEQSSESTDGTLDIPRLCRGDFIRPLIKP